MTDLSNAPSSSTLLRWTVLIVVTANLAFIVNYAKLSKSATIGAVASEFGTALMPAAFATAMGIAVLFSLVLFLVDALRPSRRNVRLYDALVVQLAVCSVLAASWVVAFRHKEILLSAALVAASTILGGSMFVRVASVAPGEHSGWLRIPFSLCFGATTLALLVALTQWSNASGLLAATVATPQDLATAVLAFGAVAGGFVALRYCDVVYPTVIASSAGAVFIAQHVRDPDLAGIALQVCVAMLVVAGLAAVASSQRQERDQPGRTSRRRAKATRAPKLDDWYLTGPSSSFMRH